MTTQTTLRAFALALAVGVYSLPATAQDQTLYWVSEDATQSFGSIHRYHLGTGQLDTLVDARRLGPDPFRVFGTVAVDPAADRLYWTDSGFTDSTGASAVGAVMSSNLDGGDVEPVRFGVICGIGFFSDIELDVDDRTLYWSTFSDCAGSGLNYLDFDGGAPPDTWRSLPSSQSYAVRAFEIDTRAQTIHWINGDVFNTPVGVYSAPLDRTTDPTRVVFGDVCDIAVDIAAGNLFWTRCGETTIYRSALDGTGTEEAVVSDAEVRFIALDRTGKQVYWSETEAGRIRRANYDGSGLEDVVTGLETPYSVELGFGSQFAVSAESETPVFNSASLRLYPNPVAETAIVTFDLGEPARVVLEVYDALGRRVDTFGAGAYPGGEHTVRWNPDRVPAGLYVVVLRANDQTDRTTATVVRL
ncbi:T9SS type A sorting domain-containing protein [Rubrivirga sp.]|uniref:T9SS type A sorting domain-containing protein n=1 Tax=Rubrivirga sp. TaxID=1885344 RepID=UPI003C735C60